MALEIGSTASSAEETGSAAVRSAVKALRRRRLLEEAAHGPAIHALSRPLFAQSLEWKEKADNLEMELQQCYQTQSLLSEQLAVKVAECRATKAIVQQKEASVAKLQSEIMQAREEVTQLKDIINEKTEAVDLLLGENQSLKEQLKELMQKFKEVKDENKLFLDRLMLNKMKDAETINEANALFQDMMEQLEISSIEKLAQQQVDGVVRQREGEYDSFVDSTIPSMAKYNISAHEGGCGSIVFQHNSDKLISGGQDGKIKIWDTRTQTESYSLHGCLGSVLDLSVTYDNKYVIAASSSYNLYVWEMDMCRMHHTLTGHTGKVCGVDANRVSSQHIVSGAYDHTIKVWDLRKGYVVLTIQSPSNCNSLSFSADGFTICSGHVDGNLRLWDSQNGKLICEVTAHSQAITSICLSQGGNLVLTTGRDNVHNLFDVRSLEVCGTFKPNGKKVASNWSRSCISPDENYVAAGSDDGTIYVWSRLKPEVMNILAGGHSSQVLSCSWSGLGKPLASSDKIGNLCIWT